MPFNIPRSGARAMVAAIGVSLSLFVASTVGAHAAVIYTTFGPGSTYDTGSSYGVYGGTPGSGYQDFASPFTLSNDATVTGFDLALFNDETGSVGATVQIITNPSNNLGVTTGNLIGGGSVSAPVGYPCCDVAATTVSGTFASPVNLTAGVVYYLLIQPASSDTFDDWYQSLTTTSDHNYQNGTDFNVTAPVGAFDLVGTSSVSATPLPAALPMFAGGAGLIGLLMRRRKQAVKAG